MGSEFPPAGSHPGALVYETRISRYPPRFQTATEFLALSAGCIYRPSEGVWMDASAMVGGMAPGQLATVHRRWCLPAPIGCAGLSRMNCELFSATTTLQVLRTYIAPSIHPYVDIRTYPREVANILGPPSPELSANQKPPAVFRRLA